MRKFGDYGPSIVVLVTAAVVLFAGPYAVKRITWEHNRARIEQASLRLEQSTLLEQLNQSFRDIATFVEPSVVHVSAEQRVQDQWNRIHTSLSTGSGWIYDDVGHIVTNYHVVESARFGSRVEVQLYNGELREAEYIGGDPTTDVAVIKIDPARIHPAVIADPRESVQQGDLVFAFGSPFDFRFSMSTGVVSGKGRSAQVIRDQRGMLGYENFIQVDAAINPGNSGGPLTDFRGEVIGMIVPVVNQLIDTGVVVKGFLGISAVDANDRIHQILGVEGLRRAAGLMVGDVSPRHPLVEGGLRPNDLIMGIAGDRVGSLEELEAVLASARTRTVPVHVWRFNEATDRGGSLDITLTMSDARGLLDLSLLQVDAEVGRLMELNGFRGHGVRVVRAHPGQPAREAGLKRHDVITHVNQEPIQSMGMLRSIVSSLLPGEVAALTVWRYDWASGEGEMLEIRVPVTRLDTIQISGRLSPDQSLTSIPELGIAKMSTATRGLADTYDVPYAPGIMIEAVVRGSGLDGEVAPGSIIISMMGSSVRSVEEFVVGLRGFDLRGQAGIGCMVITPDGEQKRIQLRLGRN